MFAFALLFCAFNIQVTICFYAYVIVSYYVAACDVYVLATLNIYAACRNIAAYYTVYIAVVINISSLGGQEATGFLVGFVELFVVFILIGNIDVATCSKAGLAFITSKAAALDVNIAAWPRQIYPLCLLYWFLLPFPPLPCHGSSCYLHGCLHVFPHCSCL